MGDFGQNFFKQIKHDDSQCQIHQGKIIAAQTYEKGAHNQAHRHPGQYAHEDADIGVGTEIKEVECRGISTHGQIGFMEMTEPRVVVPDYFPALRKDLWWHPHGESIYRGMRGFMTALYGNGLLKRLGGLTELLKVFPRVFKV